MAAQAPRTVLEVGCGEGIVIQHLTRRHPRLRVDGIELDQAALERARTRCPEARLVRGDGYALPVRSGSYDLVLCLEVLEHLEDPSRALDEILRVTRRGCLLSVPHEPFFRLGNFLRGKNLTRLGNPTDHVQHWGRRAFVAFCQQRFSVRARADAFPWLIVYGTR